MICHCVPSTVNGLKSWKEWGIVVWFLSTIVKVIERFFPRFIIFQGDKIPRNERNCRYRFDYTGLIIRPISRIHCIQNAVELFIYFIRLFNPNCQRGITCLMFGEASKDDGCSEIESVSQPVTLRVRKLWKKLFSSEAQRQVESGCNG